MSVQSRIKPQARGVTTTALSGAAPQTGAGPAFAVVDAQPFTLSATVYGQATTDTLTITPKWQARNTVGAGTWYDVFAPNNAANVVMVTGTGSAVAATRSIPAPRAVYAAMEARCIVATGVGVATTGDEFSVSYNFRNTLQQRRPIISAKKTAVTAVVGDAATVVAGPVVAMGDLEPGTLSVLLYAQATTNTLTLTGKWQVSLKGTTADTWYDAMTVNDAANVLLVTGTGSAVNTTRFVEAPDSVYGYRFARYVLVTGGTTASTGDEYSMSYQYMRPFA